MMRIFSQFLFTSIFVFGSLFAAFIFTLTFTSSAHARDQITIVGSSTVFPFSASVAEHFGRKSSFKTPVVEATGSGGGMKLFCSGIGLQYPDITNASRRIKPNEFANCQKNGIDMTEIIIGFDGIVLANSKKTARMNLTLQQIYLALAAKVPSPDCTATECEMIDNPYRKWSDIDPLLPARKIEVLGPPPTSGTRDAFQELAMEGGAKTYAYLNALKKKNKTLWKTLVHSVREDGLWIDAGENDNLMVNKLQANPNAIGVFGYSFLDQNSDKIQGALVDDTPPRFDNIANGDYNISRSLYFYIKHAHVGTILGIADFVREFTSEQAFGDEGYLLDKGLIPLGAKRRRDVRADGRTLKKLVLDAQ